jgi:O-antigen/teichoic acid export membrane protein
MINRLKQKYAGIVADTRFSEILTGSAWALSARVAATGLSLVTSIIIARCYGAEVMGIVAVLNSFLMLASIFTVLGTNTAILRLIPEYVAKYSATAAFGIYRKTQYFVIGLSIVSGCLFFLGSGFIADTVFSKPHLRFYFALAALFLVFQSLMSFNTQAVRGIRLIRGFAFMQLLPSLAKLLILVPVTFFLYHPDNPVYATLVSIAVTALVGGWIMNRTFRRKISPADIRHSLPLGEILRISMPMLMSAGMFILLRQIGVIMLGIYRPEAEVGYYSAAVKLSSLTVFVLQAINSMVAPNFSELFHTGKMGELFYVAKKSARLIFWTTTPILVFLILLGKPLILLMYGHDFVIAYEVMVIMVVGQFINGICGATGGFMNMTGHQKVLRNIIAVAAVFCIFLNFILIPVFGMTGAAVSATLGILSWNFSVLFYMKKRFGTTTAYIPFFTKT